MLQLQQVNNNKKNEKECSLIIQAKYKLTKIQLDDVLFIKIDTIYLI